MSRKRCQKGKSCGATCINKSKVCRKGLNLELSDDLPRVSSLVQGVKEPSGIPSFEPANKPVQGSSEGSEIVNKTISLFSDSNTSRTDVDGDLPANKINWNVGEGARYDAKGKYGAFVDVPPEKLAKGLGAKFPGGVGIKYGEIGENEVDILKSAGQTGAAPRLIAARVGDPGVGNPKNGERMGMIAMERVPGVTLTKALSDGSISKEDLMDKYTSTMAKLHLAGIAHKDAHLNNVILQPDGKVKFIDFGMAKKSPTEALYEAIEKATSSIAHQQGVTLDVSSPAMNKVRSNLKEINRLNKLDLLRSYDGLFPKEEVDKMATELIKELYKGVS